MRLCFTRQRHLQRDDVTQQLREPLAHLRQHRAATQEQPPSAHDSAKERVCVEDRARAPERLSGALCLRAGEPQVRA
jgi:hypothetical protein